MSKKLLTSGENDGNIDKLSEMQQRFQTLDKMFGTEVSAKF